MNGWIGVDLDGTLAHYDGWKGPEHIGRPVEAMADRVSRWMRAGIEVRIVTARVCVPEPERTQVLRAINEWCSEVFGVLLPVTNAKDFGMVELWDDRAVQVEANTGRRMDGQPDPVGPP